MSTLRTVLGSTLSLGLLLTFSVAAQDKPAAPAKPAPPPAAPTKPAPAAAPAAPPAAAPNEPPKPAPELVEFMKDMIGNWSCETTFAPGAFGPGSPEVKAKAKVKFSKGEA